MAWGGFENQKTEAAVKAGRLEQVHPSRRPEVRQSRLTLTGKGMLLLEGDSCNKASRYWLYLHLKTKRAPFFGDRLHFFKRRP